MTPFEFGQKVAAEPVPAPPAFPPKAPGLNPAGRDIRTNQQAQAWQNYGKSFGPTQYTRAPRPATPPSKPYTPNPEHQQILTNLGKQYPQFGKGDLQDMLSLHLQGRGGDLATFTRNTQQHYAQNPARAANAVPPVQPGK